MFKPRSQFVNVSRSPPLPPPPCAFVCSHERLPCSLRGFTFSSIKVCLLMAAVRGAHSSTLRPFSQPAPDDLDTNKHTHSGGTQCRGQSYHGGASSVWSLVLLWTLRRSKTIKKHFLFPVFHLLLFQTTAVFMNLKAKT